MKNRVDAPVPAAGPTAAVADTLYASLTPARAEVFDRLVASGHACTVTELATQMGHHQNTVREHLDALVHAGLATRERAAAHGRGRPAWGYTAHPERVLGDRAREYAGLAAALAGQIARTSTDPRGDAVAAGEQWGAELAGAQPSGRRRARSRASGDPALAARRRILDLLGALGFAPSADPEVTTVRLSRCPLLEVARSYPDIVCWVHLGIARGVLSAMGADPERATIHPFAEPGACRLDLRSDG